jgi:protein-disulfide isomerase
MKYLTVTALSLSLLAFAGCAQAGSGPDMKRADVEKIIQEYLMENPELLREALIELERKEDMAALNSVRDALEKDPRDVAIGPKDAKVTIVEFFDYNCGYCKKSTEWVREVMQEHPDDVRVIFKELPILERGTRTSKNAAKTALAAARQGKYSTMHFSLMKERSLTKERVEMIAKKPGLDMDKLRKDMEDEAIEEHIQDNMILANRIPAMTGTPFFVIGDQYLAGADVDRLEEMLETALKS